ncbi:MAG TPA: hypothetical protein PK299_09750, partial [Anaerolineales bacterium]|nr:hypothetical protein [Anaerolineales bacterium]
MKWRNAFQRLRAISPKRRHLRYLWWFILLAIFGVRRDTQPALDFNGRLGNLTAPYQFNFFNWTARAIANKLGQNAIQDQHYLSAQQRHAVVTQYFELLGQIQQLEDEIENVYADPGFSNHALATSQQSAELAHLRKELQTLESLAEAILQEQIALTLAKEGFGIAQQLQPPVSFNIDSLPYFLIVSPREKIENKAFANLVPGMTVAERSQLEEQVDQSLEVSSLIEPIGGLATFPTMVYETTNLPFVLEVGAHEWCHNFLMLRPLGLLFDSSPQMRTINETTCTIVGKEVGQAAVAHYYPELLPPAPTPTPNK